MLNHSDLYSSVCLKCCPPIWNTPPCRANLTPWSGPNLFREYSGALAEEQSLLQLLGTTAESGAACLT